MLVLYSTNVVPTPCVCVNRMDKYAPCFGRRLLSASLSISQFSSLQQPFADTAKIFFSLAKAHTSSEEYIYIYIQPLYAYIYMFVLINLINNLSVGIWRVNWFFSRYDPSFSSRVLLIFVSMGLRDSALVFSSIELGFWFCSQLGFWGSVFMGSID